MDMGFRAIGIAATVCHLGVIIAAVVAGLLKLFGAMPAEYSGNIGYAMFFYFIGWAVAALMNERR